MAERWNSPAKFIETIITLVLMYSGEEADSAKITDIISVLLDINSGNEAKNFSVLTESDGHKIVPKGYAGQIHFNITLLPTEFPVEFFIVLDVLRRTLSRELEAGCRPIIAYFLAFAVDAARKVFDNERLAVHSEVQIPNVQIPEVGLVGGKLDFMTARVIGAASMNDVMYDKEGRYAKPDEPTFMIYQTLRALANLSKY